MPTIDDLRYFQAMPLQMKIDLSRNRIRDFIRQYGEESCYISFSGGKDSTVLLDLIRNRFGYKNIPAVYVDTGLEYPEIREFVKQFDNVTWLKPKMNFKKVIETYGYPFISKEVSGAIEETNAFFKKIEKEKGISVRENKLKFLQDSYENNVDFGYKSRLPIRALQLIGKVPHKNKGVLTDELSRMYDKSKYGFILDAPFKVSNLCCKVMKKNPLREYAKETGRCAHFTGMMAEESMMRRAQWLKHGCNSFEGENPSSNPMSFWTEQDVLEYIKKNHIPLCSVYGDIVEDTKGTEECAGQMTISDLDGYEKQTDYDAPSLPLKTTGCDRTGCMFCGFGCHMEKAEQGRFELMKKTHPKQYEWIMKPIEDGGLNYKEVIDWLNANGITIRY